MLAVLLVLGLGHSGSDLIEVIRTLERDGCFCADCHCNVDCNISCTSAHDLYNRAAIMRLCGITQLVDHLHCSIHSSVITNGVLSALNVVVDGTRQANARNTNARQVAGTAEGTVAADDNQTLKADLLTDSLTLQNTVHVAEFRASCCIKEGTASLDDTGNSSGIEGNKFTVQQADIAALDTDYLHTFAETGTSNCSYRCIHARCVAAAGQYANFFHDPFLHSAYAIVGIYTFILLHLFQSVKPFSIFPVSFYPKSAHLFRIFGMQPMDSGEMTCPSSENKVSPISVKIGCFG